MCVCVCVCLCVNVFVCVCSCGYWALSHGEGIKVRGPRHDKIWASKQVCKIGALYNV